MPRLKGSTGVATLGTFDPTLGTWVQILATGHQPSPEVNTHETLHKDVITSILSVYLRLFYAL